MCRDLDGVGFAKNIGIPVDLSRLFADPSAARDGVQIKRKNRSIQVIATTNDRSLIMLNSIILIIAAGLLSALLYFEKQNNWKKKVPVKTLLSCLFILTAVVQTHPLPGYYEVMLFGFVFCLGGDVFLALPQKKMFLMGLISFLTGHVFYVIAFLKIGGVNSYAAVGAFLTIGTSIGVYTWLKPHLGTMKIPVIFYIIVISCMLCGAWAVFGKETLAGQGRWLVLIGALSFYVSDLFVARNQFLKDAFLNRLLGLPLYYAGQFMLAFSVGVMQ